MLQALRDEIRASTRGKLGGLLIRPAARGFAPRLDPDTYGGGYLLGLRGLVVIAHGSSSRVAIANAIRIAARGVEHGLVERLAERLPEAARARGRDPALASDRRPLAGGCPAAIEHDREGARGVLAVPHALLESCDSIHPVTTVRFEVALSRDEVFERVKSALVEQLGVDEGEITDEASFQDDLDADSLDLVELIMELEDQFGVKIPDEDAQSSRRSARLSTTSSSISRCARGRARRSRA